MDIEERIAKATVRSQPYIDETTSEIIRKTNAAMIQVFKTAPRGLPKLKMEIAIEVKAFNTCNTWPERDILRAEALERAELPGAFTHKNIQLRAECIAAGRLPDGISYTSHIDMSNLRQSAEYWISQGKDLFRARSSYNGPYQHKGWLEQYHNSGRVPTGGDDVGW